MIEVSATEVIHAPPKDVFHTMSRLETLHEWLVGCIEAWPLTDDPYRVGGKVAHIDEVMGQRFEARYEVVEWQPPSCLVFRSISGGPFDGVSELRFAPDERSTRVEIKIKGELRGAFRFGEWAAKKVVREVQWPLFKPSAMVTIDDRALIFTGQWPELAMLSSFKPWNKRHSPHASV